MNTKPFDVSMLEPYIQAISKDKEHRYRSWEVCREQFEIKNQSDSHALHLAFYLASWGMYRGSSGLLQKNHRIHTFPVKILLSAEYKSLNCSKQHEVSRSNIDDIMKLQSALADHYHQIRFDRGALREKTVTPTDTLISKILLGTLACSPAYDRYFLEGIRQLGLKHFKFGRESLEELFEYLEQNAASISNSQKSILKTLGVHYPRMKILDMYFWQIGFEQSQKNILKAKRMRIK